MEVKKQQLYIQPSCEIVQLNVEQGFAASGEAGGTIEDLGNGGELGGSANPNALNDWN